MYELVCISQSGWYCPMISIETIQGTIVASGTIDGALSKNWGWWKNIERGESKKILKYCLYMAYL